MEGILGTGILLHIVPNIHVKHAEFT
jgi:hypothetical protein